jgi:F420-non-reducing hydrogenase iron-sulfur subunit
VRYTKKLLEEIGVEPERLEMFNMSSSEAPAFVAAVEEMTRRARELGPSPVKKKASLKSDLESAAS